MHFLKTAAYVFSVAREKPGKIVACKAGSNKKYVGKNIYDVLKMRSSEIEFVENMCCDNPGRPAAVVCENNDSCIAIFFSFFTYDTAMSLVYRLHVDVAMAAYLLKNGIVGEVNVSDALAALSHDDADYTFEDVKELRGYLIKTIDEAMMLAKVGYRYDVSYVELLLTGIRKFGEHIGVEVQAYTYLGDDEQLYKDEGEVFDGGFCVACGLAFALTAFRHSPDQRLTVEIARGFKNMTLLFSLSVTGNEWEESIQHLKNVAICNGVSFDYRFEDGVVKTEIFPFYEDVAFFGVKEGNYHFSYADYLDMIRTM